MTSPKILSIDDSRMIHSVIGKAFSQHRCELFFALNGQEGLAAAAREQPDVIILDVTMPVMDGFETLGRLKSDPALKGIPVIMLTAEAGTENVMKIAKIGVRDYIVKPFTEETLLDRVGRVVSLQPKVVVESAPKTLHDRLTLLVLEDQPAAIESIRLAVQDYPWTVIGCAQVKEAAMQALKEPPDIVLVSLALPNRVPLNFLHLLRTNAGTQRIPVLGLSLPGATDEQDEARRAGFSGIVTKPLDSGDLTERIVQVLKIDPNSRFFRVEDSIHIATLPAGLTPAVAATLRREFEAATRQTVNADWNGMVLDVSLLTQADVSALELILELVHGCEAAKIELRIVASAAFAGQARGFTETAALHFFPSRAEAVASLSVPLAA